MIFRHSAVSELTHDTVIETAERLPVDIHAAVLGSGEIGLALDATGMQGMNHRISLYADTFPVAHIDVLDQYELQLFRDEALSRHGKQTGDQAFALMPCGWLDYLLEIDGTVYDAAALRAAATDWRREFSPRTGLLTTAFVVDDVRIRWTAGIAPDAVEVDYAFDACSLTSKARTVAVTVRHHQTLRDGTPLAAGGLTTQGTGDLAFRAWEASTETSTAAIYRPITVAWALACADAAVYTAEATQLAVRWTGQGSVLHTGFRLVAGSDRDGTASFAYAAGRAAVLHEQGIDGALAQSATAWASYIDSGYEVWLGDPEKEFLVLQQQYLSRAGAPWHSGYPLGTLWNRTFGGATYWDTFFAADGMLRGGHIDQVRALCTWIARSARAEGRPFYWCTYYDGQPTSLEDQAYQVCLAYAGICIRLYEYTKDREDLRVRVYPYLHRLAEFAMQEILAFDARGWHLQGEVAGDCDVEAGDASREWGMLAWVVVPMAKCADYAALLGEDDVVVARCREIADWFRQRPIPMDDPGMWALWYPHLMGLNDLTDFGESFAEFVRNDHAQVGRPQIGYQPWEPFTKAAALTISGFPDLALEYLNDGVKFTSGLGYFNEATYEHRGGGFAPYPPATGAFLSAVASPLATGHLWHDDIRVCVDLPRRWRYHRLRWRDVTTLNGARVSGTYEPFRLEATVTTDRPRRVTLGVPARMQGEPAAVTLNGEPVSCTEQYPTVTVEVQPGTHTITITRDLTAATDVLLIEPMEHGKVLADWLRSEGLTVRWHRSLDELEPVVTRAKLIIAHVSYYAFPPQVVHLLEGAVQHGTRLLTLFHGGVSSVDHGMATLTGVRAERVSPFWQQQSAPRAYTLTAAGRQALPGVPETVTVPDCADFRPRLLDDVTILAAADDTGAATVTRRPLGDGAVYWIACGSRISDLEKFGWHDLTRRIMVWGEDIADEPERRWLTDPQWRQLTLGIVREACAVSIR